MTDPQQILYIPVEIAGRELDARLLLGCAVAEAGMLVVIGRQKQLFDNIKRIPRGIFLFKGLNRVQLQSIKRAYEAGHIITATDEEALALRHGPVIARDVDPETARYCRRVYAQGKVQADCLTDLRSFDRSQVLITGNPRADLPRQPLAALQEPEATQMRREFGRFVLLNSNACAVNSAWGSINDFRNIFFQTGWLSPSDPEGQSEWRSYVQHDQYSFEAFIALLDLMPAALPDHKIVLRPHPSERFEPWAKRFAGDKRIVVTREGSNLAWIMASECVVHTSCTTGVEAMLANKPAISIVPPASLVTHWFLSNDVNLTAPDAGETTALLRDYLYGQGDPFAAGREARGAALDDHLTLGQSGAAGDAIAADLLSLVPRPLPPDYQWKVDELATRPRSALDEVKFTVTGDAVAERIGDLKQVTNRFSNVRFKNIADGLFGLSKSA
jgi:surface carbohydrate biosynthesis protein